mmetsp:Transcript_8145/g.50434  ORF Transcript_8145/g.50434 Transcript_8145/m.50434 type:complete len:256 (-) Transcript_8145:32-799(-)
MDPLQLLAVPVYLQKVEQAQKQDHKCRNTAAVKSKYHNHCQHHQQRGCRNQAPVQAVQSLLQCIQIVHYPGVVFAHLLQGSGEAFHSILCVLLYLVQGPLHPGNFFGQAPTWILHNFCQCFVLWFLLVHSIGHLSIFFVKVEPVEEVGVLEQVFVADVVQQPQQQHSVADFHGFFCVGCMSLFHQPMHGLFTYEAGLVHLQMVHPIFDGHTSTHLFGQPYGLHLLSRHAPFPRFSTPSWRFRRGLPAKYLAGSAN